MFRKYHYFLYLLLTFCFGASLLAIPTGLSLAAPTPKHPARKLISVNFNAHTVDWAGYYINLNGNTTVTSITGVSADWNISCNKSQDGHTHATWIGIGGMNGASIKLGTSSDSVSNGGLGSLWVQGTDGHPQFLLSGQNCRDHITASLKYSAQNNVFIYTIRNTSQKCSDIPNCQTKIGTIPGNLPDQTTAAWMDSRATCNNALSPLDNFNYTQFNNPTVTYNTGQTFSLQSQNPIGSAMIDNSANRLAGPQPFDNLGNFQNHWYQSGTGTSCPTSRTNETF